MGSPLSEKLKRAVVLLSGGLDSMVCAGLAKEQGFSVLALTIDYGQRHRVEIESAKRICSIIGVDDHIVLPLDLRSFGGSALTGDTPVPKDGVGEGIPVTYVPARNLIFLSLATAWGEARSAQDIFIGVNALDYSGYPDCRAEFIASFQDTARLGTKTGVEENAITLHTPLQDLTKADIAAEAVRLGLDTGLAWSCYDPHEDGRACGVCDSCRLRKKGFAEAGIEDRIIYVE